MAREFSRHVQTRPGKGVRVVLRQNKSVAVQYDFFIPAAIWRCKPIKMLLKSLESVELGATIFKGMTGIGEGAREKTHLYRMILMAGKHQRANVKGGLDSAVAHAMSGLAATRHKQAAFWYTEAEITVNSTDLVKVAAL
jgi:hypothetical protein